MAIEIVELQLFVNVYQGVTFDMSKYLGNSGGCLLPVLGSLAKSQISRNWGFPAITRSPTRVMPSMRSLARQKAAKDRAEGATLCCAIFPQPFGCGSPLLMIVIIGFLKPDFFWGRQRVPIIWFLYVFISRTTSSTEKKLGWC